VAHIETETGIGTFDDREILGVPIAQSCGRVDFTSNSLAFVFRL
jgi:hypothetical protein